MWKLIKNIFKLTLLLFAIALIFDLHYQGRSIRQLSKDYGWKISGWLYTQGKALVGKDLRDLTPSSISPKLENTLKIFESDPEKKGDVKKSLENNKEENKDQSKKPESLKGNITKLDQLTEQDRAKLKQLLNQKVKAN